MLIFQDIALCGWIPVVLFLFAWLPPRRAAIVAFLVAWLFLPNGIGYSFGSSNLGYNKITATSFGVLLAAFLFNAHGLFSFRPRWIDIPMLIWCLCPIATSLSTGKGIYDGLSVASLQSILWGIPYVIGRTHFTDLAAFRDLALGLIIGGLVYVPFCWMEMRMGTPGFWHQLIYGAVAFSYYEGWRLGGVRPMIFMSNGLMLALWMAATTLVAYWLWITRSLRTIGNVPMGWIVLILAVTEYRCVSTGALAILLLLGGSLTILRYRPLRTMVLLLVLFVPTYMTLRITQVWDGTSLVGAASMYDSGRSASLDARRQQEDDNIALAKTHIAFGVGTWEGYGADQLWVLAFRNHGLVGLSAVTLAMLLPLITLWHVCPVRTWSNPAVAPAAVVAFVVLMFITDGLFNYMLNPIYVFAAGGIMSLKRPGTVSARKRGIPQKVVVQNRQQLVGRTRQPVMAHGPHSSAPRQPVNEERQPTP